jgi:hypothetical protein
MGLWILGDSHTAHTENAPSARGLARFWRVGRGVFSILIDVQSAANQTIQFGLCTALISRSISANIEFQVYSVTCCRPYLYTILKSVTPRQATERGAV